MGTALYAAALNKADVIAAQLGIDTTVVLNAVQSAALEVAQYTQAGYTLRRPAYMRVDSSQDAIDAENVRLLEVSKSDPVVAAQLRLVNSIDASNALTAWPDHDLDAWGKP